MWQLTSIKKSNRDSSTSELLCEECAIIPDHVLWVILVYDGESWWLLCVHVHVIGPDQTTAYGKPFDNFIADKYVIESKPDHDYTKIRTLCRIVSSFTRWSARFTAQRCRASPNDQWCTPRTWRFFDRESTRTAWWHPCPWSSAAPSCHPGACAETQKHRRPCHEW